MTSYDTPVNLILLPGIFFWNKLWSYGKQQFVFFGIFVLVIVLLATPGTLTAGTYKSPMKRKENDLNQTSMIVFHVNLQGCTHHYQTWSPRTLSTKSFDIGQLWDIAFGSISLVSLGFLFVSFLNWYLDITARCHFACCQAPRLPVPFCHPWVLMDDIRVSWRRRAQIQDVHAKINGSNLQPSPMKRKEIDLNQTSAITSFQFNITKNVPC